MKILKKQNILFSKKYQKYTYTFLILISLFFIIKLWLFSSKYHTCGLRITYPCFSYDWITSSWISLFLLIFLIIGIFTKNKKNKLSILLIVCILSIISKEIFFLIKPEFEFYFTNRSDREIYKNGKFQVDTYIKYIDKYCVNDGWTYFLDGPPSVGGGRHTMCLRHRKIYIRDKKKLLVLDYIKLIEYAKNTDNDLLYRIYTSITINNWYKKILLNYNDKTYQIYLAYTIDDENILKILDIIKNITTYQDVKNFINFYLENLNEGMKLKNQLDRGKLDRSYLEKFWEKNNIKMKEMIGSMKGINHKVVY